MTATTIQPSRRRRILLALGAMLLAAAIALASGAAFTAQTVNPSNIVATGTLEQTNSNQTIFVGQNLKPGDTVDGTVTITNSGTLGASHSVAETVTGNTFAADLLQLEVTDESGDSVVYSGPLGGLGNRALGTWDAGEARTFRFEVTVPATAGNSQQGKQATVTYTWNAVQTG